MSLNVEQSGVSNMFCWIILEIVELDTAENGPTLSFSLFLLIYYYYRMDKFRHI